MIPSLACILITDGRRARLVHEQILPRLHKFSFAELVVVGDHEPGDGYRYLHVPGLTHTTTDALVKRDVGTLATTSDWLFYLCDDHVFAPLSSSWQHEFCVATKDCDVLVPSRYCYNHSQFMLLNAGNAPSDPNKPYCGGHSGIFRRSLIQARPWSTMPHDRLWDLYASRIQQQSGARFTFLTETAVEDLTSETQPWL